jgi:hypothetical protein
MTTSTLLSVIEVWFDLSLASYRCLSGKVPFIGTAGVKAVTWVSSYYSHDLLRTELYQGQ